MSTIVKNALVEAHYFIGLIKYYQGPFHWIYSIITTKIPGIEPNSVFQMFLKAINDSASPNKLVPTLLVFDTYFRITELDIPSS